MLFFSQHNFYWCILVQTYMKLLNNLIIIIFLAYITYMCRLVTTLCKVSTFVPGDPYGKCVDLLCPTHCRPVQGFTQLQRTRRVRRSALESWQSRAWLGGLVGRRARDQAGDSCPLTIIFRSKVGATMSVVISSPPSIRRTRARCWCSSSAWNPSSECPALQRVAASAQRKSTCHYPRMRPSLVRAAPPLRPPWLLLPVWRRLVVFLNWTYQVCQWQIWQVSSKHFWQFWKNGKIRGFMSYVTYCRKNLGGWIRKKKLTTIFFTSQTN